jgi:phosphoesterase RecJ-like protein
MNSIVYKQIDEQIRKAQRVLLLTDERIDGDTIGATLGMYHVLMAMDKKVTVFSPRDIPKTFSFLSGINKVVYDESIFKDSDFDLVMIFDCADGAYIKNLLPKLKRKTPLVVFDHHITNPKYGFINLIESDTASASGVVWKFVKAMNYPVSRDAAQCILTGICTDTDMFLTTSTNAACLDAAHELSRHGARLQEIVRETMMKKSIPALKLWGLAFERLHHNDEFNAIATAITVKDMQDLGARQEDLSGLINFINSMIDGADTVLVYYEKDDGSVKGSLRSHTVNVAELAQKYDGGGHIRAAGFSIQNAHLEEKDGKWFVVENKQ